LQVRRERGLRDSQWTVLAKAEGLDLAEADLAADRVLTLPKTSCDFGDGEKLGDTVHLPRSCGISRVPLAFRRKCETGSKVGRSRFGARASRISVQDFKVSTAVDSSSAEYLSANCTRYCNSDRLFPVFATGQFQAHRSDGSAIVALAMPGAAAVAAHPAKVGRLELRAALRTRASPDDAGRAIREEHRVLEKPTRVLPPLC